MSMTTTSASCLSATPRATVAPTFPAPPTTVTLRFIRSPDVAGAAREPPRASHVVDDGVAEFRGLELFRAVHQAREVVRHGLRRDCAVHALHDQVRRLVPVQV